MQSRRIIREELLTNLLVEAGAGSGKTQMLAERMAAGMATGVYQIEHMAAVTFTRKAASELRGRFHLALEKRLAELERRRPASSRNASEPSVSSAALGNLERFFAGTIHSFCARLLRERPVESGVSPGFTELDEVQDEELRKRAWRDFIASARAAGDPDMLALLDTGVRPKDLDSAFATICLNEDVEFPPGDGAVSRIRSPRGRRWRSSGRRWRSSFPADTRRGHDVHDPEGRARSSAAQLRVARTELDRPAVDRRRCSTPGTASRRSSRSGGPIDAPTTKRLQDRDRAAPRATSATATVTPYLDRVAAVRLSAVRHAAHARARITPPTERRRRNSLNYGDLLNPDREGAARERARAPRAAAEVSVSVRRRVPGHRSGAGGDRVPAGGAGRWTRDAAISVRLRAGKTPGYGRRMPEAESDADWRTVALRPGALFVVGDPKQSIYRFRRADIEIYNTVRERFSRSGHRPRRAADDELPFGAGAVRVGERACSTGCSRRSRRQHSPRFAPLDPADATERPKGDARRPLHAELRLRRREGRDRRARRRRDRAVHPREVDAGRRRFSDFLILTRKKKDRIAPYAAALEALNIPIEVSGAGAFGESPEVAALDGPAARARRSPGPADARQRAARPAVRHQRSGAVRVQAVRRLVQHLRRYSAESRLPPSRTPATASRTIAEPRTAAAAGPSRPRCAPR